MSLSNIRIFYTAVCIVLGLIIVTPDFMSVVTFSANERFSELWILGQNHKADDYPFNVQQAQTYTVYWSVVNHMGSSEYYAVRMKVGNWTDAPPDDRNSVPSLLDAVVEDRFFIADNDTREKEVSFSIDKVSFIDDVSTLQSFIVNNERVQVGKACLWNQTASGFYYQLLFELWIYDTAAQNFQFHDRFVNIWLNVTRTT